MASATVKSTDITASTDPVAPDLLEKTWTVSAATLDTLEVQVAGNVFVDVDSSLADDQVAAKVVMRASSPKLLNAVAVGAIGDDSGLRLHYKNEQVHVEGLVATTILLSKPHTLQSVSATNTQNVVLGENVVVEEDKTAQLHFSTHGNGHIFVGSSASSKFDVKSVGVVVSGDGGLQFQASTLEVAEALVISLVGAGHVAVLADDSFVANKLESAVAGIGKVFVQSSGLTVETLATEIVGKGEVSYATSGTCGNEKIRLVGEGFVNAASIVCNSADVSILGVGEAVVQATERLSTMLLLTGSVEYVNGRPKSMQSSGIVLESSIKQAEALPSTEYEPLSPPTRAATGVFLTVEAANNNNSPCIHVRPVVEPTMKLQNLSASLPESMSALVLFEVAIAAMAFVAFSAFKFQQRRIRNKYQTLLP